MTGKPDGVAETRPREIQSQDPVPAGQFSHQARIASGAGTQAVQKDDPVALLPGLQNMYAPEPRAHIEVLGAGTKALHPLQDQGLQPGLRNGLLYPVAGGADRPEVAQDRKAQDSSGEGPGPERARQTSLNSASTTSPSAPAAPPPEAGGMSSPAAAGWPSDDGADAGALA